MSDFDPFDEELGHALQLRAPDVDGCGLETAAAHDAVLARARGIRRRRAALTGGVAMLFLAVGGFVLLNGDDERRLGPVTEPSTSAPVATLPGTTTPGTTLPAATVPGTRPSTTTAPIVVTVPAPSTAAISTTPATATSPPPVATDPPATAPAAPPTAPTSSSSSSTTIADPGTAPFTRTYSSTGGSITVSWNGSGLSLVSVDPAAEHESEIEDDSAARIRVRFRGPAESRIELRVENGQVVERID